MPLDTSSAHYAIGDHPIDTCAHLDRALTKLHRVEDCGRIGPVYFALIEEAADELEQAGHANLATDLREGEPVRLVTDAVRGLLNG
jgi:hypothetical protein